MSPVSDLNSGRPLVERSPSAAPGGRPAPPDVDLATEVAALAALLAEVVRLAGDSALFPSRWELIAELALEHESVCAALLAEQTASATSRVGSPPLSSEHIVAQLNELRDLIRDGHARC